jgi:hypothetical protein
MTAPALPASTSKSSPATISASKWPWIKKDMKNNALAHSITAAKVLQGASDLTGIPYLKSVVGGLMVILENVEV